MTLSTIVVAGQINEVAFQKARTIVEAIGADSLRDYEVMPMTEVDWCEFLPRKCKELGAALGFASETVIVYEKNGELIGNDNDVLQWARKNFRYRGVLPEAVYEALAQERYEAFFRDSKHTFCFFDIQYESYTHGRFVFELFDDMCPDTCANFISLCTSNVEDQPSYSGSIIHHITSAWIQGGDIETGRGDNSRSFTGKDLPDECFEIKHDRVGILGMANKGAHTNGSQFYVTMKAARWMDHKFVAFGRLIEGYSLLNSLQNFERNYDRTIAPVIIQKCGVLYPTISE